MDETLKMLAEFLKNVKLDNTKVNIYRGEPKPEFLPKDKLNKGTGRWFTVDKKYAQQFANKPNNHLIKEEIKVKNLAKASGDQLKSNLMERKGTLTGNALKNAELSYKANKKLIKPRIRANISSGKSIENMPELKEFKFDRKLIPSVLSKVLRYGSGSVGALSGMFYEPGNIMSEEEEIKMLNQYVGNN